MRDKVIERLEYYYKFNHLPSAVVKPTWTPRKGYPTEADKETYRNQLRKNWEELIEKASDSELLILLEEVVTDYTYESYADDLGG